MYETGKWSYGQFEDLLPSQMTTLAIRNDMRVIVLSLKIHARSMINLFMTT